ncbi:hypothetical protein CkaCkLH20_10553 [Colletotrichum karsti]|uniref:Uncharacterized protein n=1 Tax=Colletotrichum karsti TaxID=1095194 RepID=A0A9P6LG83_9PEZI|nr:uncharacterized protein CkaCkLH20_10553 [Colletotrichum karsti]KAF9871921.1 hypothetical protein CkaCkLH20_10553 [Colletotrichum karsti]
MGRFSDCVREYLAVLVDITGLKKEKPEDDIEMDTKVETKVDAKVNTNVGCSTHSHSPETRPAPDHKPPAAAQEGWKHRPNAEFPWRLEQVVEEEENWRGTWVLEVKDMRAMDWGTAHVPKADGDGRGGRHQRQPTRHLPFPVDGNGYRETLTGGQDDLMVQLGKR